LRVDPRNQSGAANMLYSTMEELATAVKDLSLKVSHVHYSFAALDDS
jgi:uncharacterized protein YukE